MLISFLFFFFLILRIVKLKLPMHQILKHQQVIEELMEENEKLRHVLVEDLKIPPSKLQASFSSKNKSPCTDCFECRRKQRKK